MAEMSALTLAGYAAVFGAEDLGGDIVEPGAFAATLATGRALPLLWQHRGDRVVGRVAAASEDARGLRIVASLDDADAAALVAEGAIGGLSFGYRVRASQGARPRRLQAVDLIEISLVAVPMQPLARVIAIHRAAA